MPGPNAAVFYRGSVVAGPAANIFAHPYRGDWPALAAAGRSAVSVVEAGAGGVGLGGTASASVAIVAAAVGSLAVGSGAAPTVGAGPPASGGLRVADGPASEDFAYWWHEIEGHGLGFEFAFGGSAEVSVVDAADVLTADVDPFRAVLIATAGDADVDPYRAVLIP